MRVIGLGVKAGCLNGAMLVIAKLVRLSRDAAFLLTLRKYGTRFVAANVNANELTEGIMVLVTQ